LRIRDKDQYNFTDPQSRMMKNSGNLGFDQHYNALLIISHSLSNHPNDQLDALPTIDAINPRVGSAKRAALDAGYFSVSNIEGLQSRQIDPYIATGRQAHDSYWKTQNLLSASSKRPWGFVSSLYGDCSKLLESGTSFV
jgi:hypothetical protein